MAVVGFIGILIIANSFTGNMGVIRAIFSLWLRHSMGGTPEVAEATSDVG